MKLRNVLIILLAVLLAGLNGVNADDVENNPPVAIIDAAPEEPKFLIGIGLTDYPNHTRMIDPETVAINVTVMNLDHPRWLWAFRLDCGDFRTAESPRLVTNGTYEVQVQLPEEHIEKIYVFLLNETEKQIISEYEEPYSLNLITSKGIYVSTSINPEGLNNDTETIPFLALVGILGSIAIIAIYLYSHNKRE